MTLRVSGSQPFLSPQRRFARPRSGGGGGGHGEGRRGAGAGAGAGAEAGCSLGSLCSHLAPSLTDPAPTSTSTVLSLPLSRTAHIANTNTWGWSAAQPLRPREENQHIGATTTAAVVASFSLHTRALTHNSSDSLTAPPSPTSSLSLLPLAQNQSSPAAVDRWSSNSRERQAAGSKQRRVPPLRCAAPARQQPARCDGTQG